MERRNDATELTASVNQAKTEDSTACAFVATHDRIVDSISEQICRFVLDETPHRTGLHRDTEHTYEEAIKFLKEQTRTSISETIGPYIENKWAELVDNGVETKSVIDELDNLTKNISTTKPRAYIDGWSFNVKFGSADGVIDSLVPRDQVCVRARHLTLSDIREAARYARETTQLSPKGKGKAAVI
ncbi:uncharacterized protein IL334_006413 [Kwoniella shivajii]|uniref:Uncharacterized protein n=1 Tax=Kwoniella shivajii TaxID=564305 RepID=A0ABZ1D5W4_9TREE|nr:hypothetical protein IL334_006413 [Kwoniella shivajii]